MIQEISKKTGIPEKEVKEVINHFFTACKQSIKEGDRPIIRTPFGSWVLKLGPAYHYVMNRIRFYKENRDKYTEKNKEKLSKMILLTRKFR